jgi:Bacteriophage Lambda NinG protein
MKFRQRIHRVGTTEIQRVRSNTQRVVNAMIRERDAGQTCISCGKFRTLEAGHFRTSTHGTTRFHPWNLNGQCASCNRFAGGVTYEYSVTLDKKFGKGTAAFLERLSRKIEPWSVTELDQLRAAARYGYPVYLQVYRELRPHHFPVRKTATVRLAVSQK